MLIFDYVETTATGKRIMVFKGMFNTPVTIDKPQWEVQMKQAVMTKWSAQIGELSRGLDALDKYSKLF